MTTPTPEQPTNLPLTDPSNPLVFNFLGRPVAVTTGVARHPQIPEPLALMTFRDGPLTFTHVMNADLLNARIAELEALRQEMRRQTTGLIVPPSGFNPGPLNGHQR